MDEVSGEMVQHMGLYWSKFSAPVAKDRSKWLATQLQHVRVPDGYREAYLSWQARTPPQSDSKFQRTILRIKTESRVVCGMGIPSSGDNGLSMHHLWGTPIIPGSSLKGVARSYAEDLHRDELKGAIDLLFGSEGDSDQALAGAVDFLDAWWEPHERPPWQQEILTPHARNYYAGKGPPNGQEAPMPISFLAAAGTFRCVVEGPPEWVDLAADLLHRALEQRGVGAKTRIGYGVFSSLENDSVDRLAASRIAREQQARLFAALSPFEQMDYLHEQSPDPEAFAKAVVSIGTGNGAPMLTKEGDAVSLKDVQWPDEKRVLVGSWLQKHEYVDRWAAGGPKAQARAREVRSWLTGAEGLSQPTDAAEASGWGQSVAKRIDGQRFAGLSKTKRTKKLAKYLNTTAEQGRSITRDSAAQVLRDVADAGGEGPELRKLLKGWSVPGVEGVTTLKDALEALMASE